MSDQVFVLQSTVFQWNEDKAAYNVRKHGITFAEAATAFLDDHARVFDDPDHSYEEQRFLLVGQSALR